MHDTCLVLIILRNAPIEVILVTICALPVHESVTVMTGQEKARKSPNDAKRWPHERSYLGTVRRSDQTTTYRVSGENGPWNTVVLEVANVCGVDLGFMIHQRCGSRRAGEGRGSSPTAGRIPSPGGRRG